MSEAYDPLKLENQLCFPLYAVSRALIRRYYPVLSALELTYTQYITMMVLWQEGSASVKQLGKRLYLDTGTMTPLLKSMEQKGLIERRRSRTDERCVTVSLTEAGLALRERALAVPGAISPCLRLEPQEAQQLRELLNKMLDELDE